MQSNGEEILGQKVYKEFGTEFPLLIKFIDASDDLSIQVHPGNEMAEAKHNSKGKTEMWYVVDADEGSELNCGFVAKMNKSEVRQHIQDNTLIDILNFVPVQQGDSFFIPAGTVHAIGKGLLIAEIQQASDITYRLYDFDRKDVEGKTRELHIEDSLNTINYDNCTNEALPQIGGDTRELVNCRYFTTNHLSIHSAINRDIIASILR